MKNLDTRLTFTLGLALATASLAGAQDRVSSITGKPPQGDSRIEVGLAYAQSIGSTTFSGTQTVKDYAEDGTLKTSSRKATGTFDAQVPHPFFFSRLRSVSGTEADMGFSESAFYLTAVYRGGSGKWKFNVEAGPALFNVNATVADHLTLGETYPYDTVQFSGVTSSKKKVSPFGFAVGLEVGRQVSNAVAVVVQGRFSQGTGDLDVNGQKMSVKAGGGQIRAGLRITAARKKAGS